MSDYHERCLKCRWLAPDLNPPCGRVFQVHYHVHPKGGTIDVTFTPGMIPEELTERLKQDLGRVFERVAEVIDKWPGWHDIAAAQAVTPSRSECPGREEIENPFVRVVYQRVRHKS